jgi:carbamoyl-phosphate synthase large subunit
MKLGNSIFVIVGGSQSQMPFIQAANNLGYRTIVFDRNPSAPGAAIADKFYPFSTHDIESILGECDRLAKKNKIASIITYSAYTMPLKVVARASEEFGLRSFSIQAVNNTTNKAKMKQKLCEVGVPTPEWSIEYNWENTESFYKKYGPSIIIKPASGSMGSSGVSMVREEKQLHSAFEKSSEVSEDGQVIVEKFYEGREFSVDGIINENRATVLAVSEKLNLGETHNFIISGFTTGRNSDTDFKYGTNKIVKVVLQAVKALGINNSFFGADVLLTDKGPLVLEVGLLLDAKIDRLLFFAGVDVYDMRCKVAVGDEINFQPLNQSKGYALQFMFADRVGRLSIKKRWVIELTDINPTRILVEWERHEGDMVVPPKSVADILGWVIVKDVDQQKALSYAKKVAKSGLFNLMS